MAEFLEHAVVALAALGAAWIIVRRVVSAVVPDQGESPCASCPAAQALLHDPPPQPREEAASESGPAQPLILVRTGRR
jgi:hypothetical protein